MTGLLEKKEMLHLSHLSSVYLCKHNKSAELIIAQPDGTSCDADLIRRSVEQDGGKAHVAVAGLNCLVLISSCLTTS